MNRTVQLISILLVLAGLACGETVNGPPRYTLSGTIVDSVTGAPVQAAMVSANGEAVASDTIGAFALPVDSGVVQLTIAHPDYEQHSVTLQLVESHSSDFGLRRFGPFVRDYLSVAPFSGDDPGLETALVGDLQGSSNTDTTRGEAQLWFGDSPFELSISHQSENVEWVDSDSLTIQVAVWLAPGLSSRDSVLWTLYDVDGHTARWLCYPSGHDPECEERL